MPQMKPINWMMLFYMMNMIILFIIINIYNFNMKINYKKMMKMTKYSMFKLNWKW